MTRPVAAIVRDFDGVIGLAAAGPIRDRAAPAAARRQAGVAEVVRDFAEIEMPARADPHG